MLARASHVAIPPSYHLGPFDGFKRTGIRLWAEFGPRAPRRLAAIEYSTRYIDCFPLPTGRDWAAQALDFEAPGPFIRGVPGGGPVVIPAIAQSKAQYIAHTTED